jgi:hypothetical protein
MASPTARTLELLRKSGYVAESVEKWIPGANIRRDLFGMADVLAVHPHRRPAFLLVQATTRPNVGARLKKARARPELAAWLRAGGAFEVWGWFRRGKRWEVHRAALRAEDLAAVVIQVQPRTRRRPVQPGLFDGTA